MAKRRATDGTLNRLYYGDNLAVLRRDFDDESIDLIYLDPPFNSKKVYNVIFKSPTGAESAAQVKAFEDTWRWNPEVDQAYEEIIGGGAPGNVADAVSGFRKMLGQSDAMAYLTMMAIRLVELRRVLKDDGSIFLHCDPTASHYLKVILDNVFGAARFRNEIAWCYTGPGTKAQRQFSRKHDIIFWYSNGESWTFNADDVRIPYDAKTIENYKSGLVGSGFAAGDDLVERELSAKGKIPEDYWPIAIAPRGKEYLGYPTQKPIALLDRILRAASNEGDVVLDPFCGCGTTVDAAQRLHRRWLGIDISYLAIDLIQKRLLDRYGPAVVGTYEIDGVPADVLGAQALFDHNPLDFERWAVSLLNAQPNDKQVGDRGIDGRVRFYNDRDSTGTVIVSVKGGKAIQPTMVRDLIGTVQHNGELGVLLTMAAPTRGVREAAAAAGTYTNPLTGQVYPKIQVVTIDQLMAGVRPNIPNAILPYVKAKPFSGQQGALPL